MTSKQAGAAMAAVMMASAGAAQFGMEFEGWRTVGYLDPVKVFTNCGGVTGPAIRPVMTDAECIAETSKAYLIHGLAIAPCLPPDLPYEVRMAFTDFAYNVGVKGFCGSGAAQAARAGQLGAACRRINTSDTGKAQWIYAGGVALPGLIRRRAAERTLCEKGLPHG